MNALHDAKEFRFQKNSLAAAPAEFAQSKQKSTTHTAQSKSLYRSRGTTSVEIALICPLFFILMFMVIDFALYGYVKLTMQHAVREGARYAITGQVDLDPQAENDRQRAVIQKIRDNSMGFFDEVMTEADIQVTDSHGSPVSGFGDPGESIVITLNCEWPTISPFTQAVLSNNNYNFSVRASMRNENFPGVSP